MSGSRRGKALLTARTVRNLRPAQVAHRARLRALRWPPGRPVGAALIERSSPSSDGAPGWPAAFRPLDLQAVRGYPSPEDNAAGVFEFLNDRRHLGRPPQWRQPGASRLWRYHLDYFHWAWSFAAHPDPAWAAPAFTALWRSWAVASPFGRGDAWSPYVASLRAWALCGVHRPLVARTDGDGDGDGDGDMLAFLARHAAFLRWHLELDVGGNHLVKNLKALAGLGVFLGDDGLVGLAERHLERQLPVQILSDGGHFERSPSYHCDVLGDLIDVAALLAAAGRDPVPGVDAAIGRMRRWLGLMLMPDGDVPLFNDCTLVGADRLAALRPGPPATGRVTVLEPSGYVVVRPDQRTHLVADVGPPCPPDLPAHAQADCLSFELATDGARRIVDTGTSTYEPGPRRAFERSTAAHNTVSVDGLDQTEVWGVFRAARLARPTLERADDDGVVVTVTASHDGYRRLPGGPVHRRTWAVEPGRVRVTDDIGGSGLHRLESRLHVLGATALPVDWSGPPGFDVDTAPATVATDFGELHDAQVMTARWTGRLPARLSVDIALPAAPGDQEPDSRMVETVKGSE